MALLWVFGAVMVCFYQVTSETGKVFHSLLSNVSESGGRAALARYRGVMLIVPCGLAHRHVTRLQQVVTHYLYSTIT